jgi:hypothetical protein
MAEAKKEQQEQQEQRARIAHWLDTLDADAHSEIAMAQIYAKRFGSGVASHKQLLLIAKLADMLDEAYGQTMEAEQATATASSTATATTRG